MNTMSLGKKKIISLQIFRSYFIIILYRSLMVGCLTFGRSHADGEYIFKHLNPCSNMRALLQWMQRLEEWESRETACSGRGGGKAWSVSKWWWRNCILLLKVCLFVEGEGGGLSVIWSRHLWKMKRSWPCTRAPSWFEIMLLQSATLARGSPFTLVPRNWSLFCWQDQSM